MKHLSYKPISARGKWYPASYTVPYDLDDNVQIKIRLEVRATSEAKAIKKLRRYCLRYLPYITTYELHKREDYHKELYAPHRRIK